MTFSSLTETTTLQALDTGECQHHISLEPVSLFGVLAPAAHKNCVMPVCLTAVHL
jgi:hypothetical protein